MNTYKIRTKQKKQEAGGCTNIFFYMDFQSGYKYYRYYKYYKHYSLRIFHLWSE